MPIGFLTATERDRLNHFPTPIPDEDLRAFFWLSEDDQHVVNQQREAHTRLGFALQLCALRYLGFAPDDLSTTPEEAVLYVARQLDVPPAAIHAYGQRVKTRTTHFQQVQAYLGFRTATPLDVYALQTWLGERALEHDKPSLLLQLACDKLRRDQIIRPGEIHAVVIPPMNREMQELVSTRRAYDHMRACSDSPAPAERSRADNLRVLETDMVGNSPSLRAQHNRAVQRMRAVHVDAVELNVMRGRVQEDHAPSARRCDPHLLARIRRNAHFVGPRGARRDAVVEAFVVGAGPDVEGVARRETPKAPHDG